MKSNEIFEIDAKSKDQVIPIGAYVFVKIFLVKTSM